MATPFNMSLLPGALQKGASMVAPSTAAKSAMGQQGPNALQGDFLGGSKLPLQTPNVQRPTSATGPAASAFPTSKPSSLNPLQDPGNNFTNPGYGEQAVNYTQNRLLNDPFASTMQNAAQGAMQQTGGEQYLNQNLGSLNGPGQGDQYWNQVSGQFQDPFSGEQFARLATQQFSPQGASSAFNNQAMGQYGQFTGYTGPQNTQGQYGTSSASLAGGTAGENTLGQIAGGYNQFGQYNGPNLSAGQYGATQSSFGAMPVANSADPYYDRAVQLGTQDYNRQAAGRGVYGSSEALSGVGNMIADLNAQRAQTTFGNEMSIAQENRMRQELLGNQARNADLSSLGAFGANLSGAQTFGNLANQQGQLELNRHELLGNMANNADTQATSAQNANISGLNAFASIANNADVNETRRFDSRTQAMNNADKTQLDRLQTGADIAFRSDENKRANYDSQNAAANNAAQLALDRNRTGAEIASSGSMNDLARLNAFNNQAQGAESQRQGRLNTTVNATQNYSNNVQAAISDALGKAISGDQAMTEEKWQMEMVPLLQQAGMEQKQIDQLQELFKGLASGAIAKA